ncbi:MAG: hypothetical protein EA363_13265 [Balneolaceae bacterium]|nr:MAG: hypothetical protein EA363_13265 [Balneolaceae bacterium]
MFGLLYRLLHGTLRGPSYKLVLGLLLLGMLTTPAQAQWSMGARSIAMGQAHTALPSDTWALFHNPASMRTGNTVLGFFTIRYYGIRELEDQAAVLSVPLHPFRKRNQMDVSMGAGFHTYGFDLYRETRAISGVALRLDRLRIGFSANYVHIRIDGYGSRGSPVFDAGVIAGLGNGFQIGYRISHILATDSGDWETDLHPSEMAGGISWNGMKGLLMAVDLVKDSLHPLSLRAGAEAELPGGLFLRGGWTSRPFTWSAGTGLQLNRIHGNLAVQKHDVLGLSPGIDFQLHL